jgi:hypothetical protein
MKQMLQIFAGLILFGPFAFTQGKPRIYIGDSNSWERPGGRGQTSEVIKTFSQRCPSVLVNNNSEMSDYSVSFDHEGGKWALRKDNKIAVFNRSGDSIFSASARILGSSVQSACSAILADWQAHGRVTSNNYTAQQPPAVESRKNMNVPSHRLTTNLHVSPVESGAAGNVPVLGITAEAQGNDGAKIVEIDPGGVGELARLQMGDIVNSVDGKRVRTPMELTAELANRVPGSLIRLGLVRGHWQSEAVIILRQN